MDNIDKIYKDIFLEQSIENIIPDYYKIFDMVSDAIILYQIMEGRILDANQRFIELSEYTKNQLLQLKLRELGSIPLFSKKKTLQMIKKGVDQGSLIIEWKMKSKTGKLYWLEGSFKLIEINGTNCIIAINRDISQRKKDEKQLKRYQKKLQSLSSKLSLAEEKERRRIADYLHDYIGNNLAISKMKIKSLYSKLNDPLSANEMQDIIQIVEETMQLTQSLTFDLSPPILYDLGLEAAIEWLCDKMNESHPMEFIFQPKDRISSIDEEISILVFKTIRELLYNSIKHSSAKQITVLASHRKGLLKIQVGDDGKGFNPSILNNYSLKDGGFGLFNIRERLKYISGKLDIKSSLGQGTQITISIPIKGK